MPLESLLGPTVTTWIAHLVAALTAFALLYGAAKILWIRLAGRPFPVNRFTRTLDALAELGTNVIGFANKLRSPNGAPLIPNPDVLRRDALIEELRTSLADYQRRVAGSHAVTEPTPFDPSARQTIAPDVAAAVRDTTNT